MNTSLDEKNIFITGGTGSFGNHFVKTYLGTNKITIFSRDEMKQFFMAEKFNHHPNLKFVIGDVRDAQALSAAVSGNDILIHAAATKIVPLAERNPLECLKTNVLI